ncbi:MAG: sugar transferase [Hyphomicrobiaceae bacterium]
MKRIFDAFAAGLALIVLLPILLAIAGLVRLHLGTPIFFRQQRPGLNGAPFKIIKFRTMTDAVDANGLPLQDSERLGALGRFLRSTSVDELPELINVLKGEMSFVGPRPLLMEYLPLYSREQARRHEVRPGITGWAQINGRNGLDWETKFALDVWYVDNRSVALDLEILALTVLKVLRREGINAAGVPTAAKFARTGGKTL